MGIWERAPFFWIGAADASHPASKVVHVAFAAETKTHVDKFYEAALAAGAQDNGRPGYRSQYGRGYYAAFVIDIEGHNIEAVHYDPDS